MLSVFYAAAHISDLKVEIVLSVTAKQCNRATPESLYNLPMPKSYDKSLKKIKALQACMIPRHANLI